MAEGHELPQAVRKVDKLLWSAASTGSRVVGNRFGHTLHELLYQDLSVL